MKTAMRALLVALALVAATLATGAPPCAAGGNCGLKPLKPLPPLGCRDVVAVCTCDSRGQNCRWVWQCVPL